MTKFYSKDLRRKITRNLLNYVNKTCIDYTYPKYLIEILFYNYINKPEELKNLNPYYFEFVTELLTNVRFIEKYRLNQNSSI